MVWLKLLILGLLAAISARNFAMGFNRYADRDIDKYNPKERLLDPVWMDV